MRHTASGWHSIRPRHPPSVGPGRQTIGGVIAGNAAGPRRLKGGAPRDHLLGFTAVSGHGEVFRAGGRVVKNVTGFDLCKLMAGSRGTLAALTEVTVRGHARVARVADAGAVGS